MKIQEMQMNKVDHSFKSYKQIKK